MSAYIKRSTYKDESILIECSICQAGISPKKTQEINDTFRFCWHCGVKFGPEPKTEPTGGEWWYDRSVSTNYGKVYSKDDLGRNELIASVTEMGAFRETNANGYLMAASKKLLAACKANASFPTEMDRQKLRDAIAEAEKGKQ